MARRSQYTREELREKALDAAEKIVAEQGSEALSTRKIAACIGYTAGSLYLVFENLDDLILQVNARTLRRLHQALRATTDQVTAPEQTIQALGMAYYEFACRHVNLWRLLFEHHLPDDQSLPDWFRSQVAELFGLVEGQLKRLSPGMESAQIQRSARALWGGVHGIVVLSITGKLDVAGADEAKQLIHSLLHYYLQGWLVGIE